MITFAGTSTCVTEKALTIDDLRKMVDKLKRMPEPEWMLVSPDGVVYKGTAGKLIPVLAADESIMRDIANYSPGK